MITPEAGAVIAGRYTLLRLVGRGGMGSVWLARHRDLDIDVAVKLMAPALVASSDARMRFEREARVAAPLNSQHVVRVHDYGVDEGAPYIVMEVLRGESLSARLARQRRLSPAVAGRLLVQICKALSAAHEAGLVHRDLKPANVFLALQDKEEVVKVLDFGIAKSSGLGEATTETATGMMLGSAHYMSPEQIRSSKEVDHRSDLWSVGIILYRMLTGQLPFTGVDLGDVLVRVCTDVFARPSAIAPDLPAGLDEFFERALARLPVQRFQSAMDLTAAFESARAREPLTASSHAVGRNGTIAMPPLASALTVGVVEGPRDSAPTEEWKPALVEKATGAAPQATTAPEPAATVAPDVNPASISAVLVMGRRPGSSPAITPPVARNTIAHGRALIALSAIAGVLALAGIVGPTLLRHTGTQPLPAEPLVAAAAPPPRVDAARVVEPMSPGPPALEPSQSALPAASLAPSAAARPPKPPSLRKDPIHVPTTPAVAPILPPQQPQPKSDAPAVKPVVVLDPAARED